MCICTLCLKLRVIPAEFVTDSQRIFCVLRALGISELLGTRSRQAYKNEVCVRRTARCQALVWLRHVQDCRLKFRGMCVTNLSTEHPYKGTAVFMVRAEAFYGG